MPNYFDAMCGMTGYEGKTAFWDDFTCAENYSESDVRNTYKRAFAECKTDYKYMTELVLVLNWKIWEHFNAGRTEISRVYDELWRKASGWCVKNLRGDELSYYLRTVD